MTQTDGPPATAGLSQAGTASASPSPQPGAERVPRRGRRSATASTISSPADPAPACSRPDTCHQQDRSQRRGGYAEGSDRARRRRTAPSRSRLTARCVRTSGRASAPSSRARPERKQHRQQEVHQQRGQRPRDQQRRERCAACRPAPPTGCRASSAWISGAPEAISPARAGATISIALAKAAAGRFPATAACNCGASGAAVMSGMFDIPSAHAGAGHEIAGETG